MSAGDMFCRCPEHELEQHLHTCIKWFQLRGKGGNIVKDEYRQLSPPEYATWTGANFQLALCRNGRNVWLEVRQFMSLPAGDTMGSNARNIIPVRQVCDRKDYATAVGAFCEKETP